MQPGDYTVICSWYEAIGQTAPKQDYFPQMSTFIAEIDGVRALSVTLYTMSVPMGWVDNFIGEPLLRGSMRRMATRVLLQHLEEFAKALNYEKLFCMTTQERLRSYYEEMGFVVARTNVSTLIKELQNV